MTPQELAEQLDQIIDYCPGDIVKQAATMLRKQADDLEYMQEQFDRAIEFLAKCNGWSKNK